MIRHADDQTAFCRMLTGKRHATAYAASHGLADAISSEFDVVVGHMAGVPVVGFADRDGNAERFAAVGADAVVTQFADVTQALRATRPS